jgi:hypothetical protein
VVEKHFQGFPAVETPQVARRQILPEFFQRAYRLPVRQIKVYVYKFIKPLFWIILIK